MKCYTQEELNEVLRRHKMWLCGDANGVRANLRGSDIRNTNLIGADLCGADFSYAVLINTLIIGSNLRGANLTGAHLKNAFLINANLESADLSGADLEDAFLIGANLSGVTTDNNTMFYRMRCPEEGSFIGYKRCSKNRIVKLLIPEDAKRSSATSNVCRCSKAKVLSITDLYGINMHSKAISIYDKGFVYRVSEIVEVDNFCEDRWQECAAGIHFFMTRQEAVKYKTLINV